MINWIFNTRWCIMEKKKRQMILMPSTVLIDNNQLLSKVWCAFGRSLDQHLAAHSVLPKVLIFHDTYKMPLTA